MVWLAPNPAPCLLARPGTESAPWLRALPRAAVRLCPLEACGVFPPLTAGGCCLVWRASGACRTGFVLYIPSLSLCHLGRCRWFRPSLPCRLSASCVTRSARMAEHCFLSLRRRPRGDSCVLMALYNPPVSQRCVSRRSLQRFTHLSQGSDPLSDGTATPLDLWCPWPMPRCRCKGCQAVLPLFSSQCL